MQLDASWTDRFLRACSKASSARSQSLSDGQSVYLSDPDRRCWVVKSGYIKVLDPRPDGGRYIRLILGRGNLFGDRPFRSAAFDGFSFPQYEQAVAHGPTVIIALHRSEIEIESHTSSEFAALLLESITTRTEFLERRLFWQFTTPIRSRIAATLRDLICFQGQRCKHGHTVDVRLTQQDLAELVGAARPVVNAELVRMRNEGTLEYTRCYFCVDNLDRLHHIAIGEDEPTG